MQKKNNRGITLVALVVTIIVLAILVGITFASTVGENGLITTIKQGKQNVISEQESQNIKLNQLEKDRESTGINNPTGGGTNNPSRDDTGVNSPALGEGMIPIKHNGTNWVICSTDDIEWFNYEIQTSSTEASGTSKWANVMMSDGTYKAGKNANVGTIVRDSELGSMFVWIPRYAYKITYYTDANKTTVSSSQTAYGSIDVKFINGVGNIAWDKTQCRYANWDSSSNDYIVHPAFTADANFGGGFGQLSGLWIAKFESSRSDATATSEGNSNTLKAVPSVTSWRNTTTGDMYKYAKAYNTTLKSHMLKNSEWGAVVYLAHSKYGRNGAEVAVNQCSNYITGAGPGTGTSHIYNSTYIYDANFQTNYSYNTTQGKKASTTGNVYGIYDISGGAYEFTASYYNGSSSLSNGNTFASKDGTSNEWSTVYTGTTASSSYIKGDATYETSNWNFDVTYFVSSDFPFFLRGGFYIGTDYAGAFYFNNGNGDASSDGSFRVCLIVM